MKYVLLIHTNPAAWAALPKEEADRVLGDHFAMIGVPDGSELLTGSLRSVPPTRGGKHLRVARS